MELENHQVSAMVKKVVSRIISKTCMLKDTEKIPKRKTKTNLRLKQNRLNANRSPCTVLIKIKSDIIPIKKLIEAQIKADIVIQEVKEGFLYFVMNSNQISKNKIRTLFDTENDLKMKSFRISLKVCQSLFSKDALVYSTHQINLKGEKAKIVEYFPNHEFFLE